MFSSIILAVPLTVSAELALWGQHTQRIISEYAYAVDSPRGPCGSTPPPVRALFESPEHKLLGDTIRLQFDDQNITGADFQYEVGSVTLTFGQVVTLADFYSNWSFDELSQCNIQISDPRQSWQQKIDLFNSLIGRVSNDDAMLTCLMTNVESQGSESTSADDPAQCYADRSGFYDRQYTYCSKIAYLGTALCNWDHFGVDAHTSYSVGHAAAIASATKATSVNQLKQAYYAEAFAQHFLSDCFSSGHLRTPRRALHSGLYGLTYPGDNCNRYMHDEDSANGLWVRNSLGQEWPMYGDKQLLSDKSFRNRDQAVAAMQKSVDEIFAAYRSRAPIQPAEFSALPMLPVVPGSDDARNFRPMFSISGDGEKISLRAALDQRDSAAITSYSVKDLNADVSKWAPIDASVSSSGPVVNMYPRTLQNYPGANRMQGFTPETNLTQIRIANSTHFILNRYGPVWTRLYQYFPGQTLQRSWNMLSQSILSIGRDLSGSAWHLVLPLSSSSYFLAGVVGGKTTHIGISEDSNGNLVSLYVADANTSCTSASFVSGYFNMRPNVLGAIRHCGENGVNELWTFLDCSKAPVKADSWTTTSESNRFAFAAKRSGRSDVYVETNYHVSNSSTTWSFTQWTDMHTKRETATFLEQNTFPAANYLVDSSEGSTLRVIRINYAKQSTMKMDILAVSLDGHVVTSFREDPFPFDLTACDRLEWFLMDLKDKGANDVVAYCSNTGTLQTIVRLVQTNGSFGPPEVSTIPADFYSAFNGPFSKPLVSFAATRFDPYTQRPAGTRSSIMQLFDNYGVLGARLLSPNPLNNELYIATGQYPAIAGQLSRSLGPNGLGFITD